MNKIINTMISVFVFTFFTSVTFSVEMPKVPKVGGGGGDKIDVDALVDQQSALVKNMTSALDNIMEAQGKFAEAFKKKELVQSLQKGREKLEKGEKTPKKDVKATVKIMTDAQVILDQEMEKTTLDAEGKLKFAEGLPPYGTGTINMVGAGIESVKLFKSLKGTKNLNVIRKLGNLIYLGKTAPSLISNFSSATSNISKFTSKNEIPQDPSLKKAEESLAGVSFN